jgi:hypothetical protein
MYLQRFGNVVSSVYTPVLDKGVPVIARPGNEQSFADNAQDGQLLAPDSNQIAPGAACWRHDSLLGSTFKKIFLMCVSLSASRKKM